MAEEILYSPLAHLPRSMVRQRSEQKGTFASVMSTGFLQMGQGRVFLFVSLMVHISVRSLCSHEKYRELWLENCFGHVRSSLQSHRHNLHYCRFVPHLLNP